MEIIITEIAQRIRDLRDIMGYTTAEMAQTVGCSEEEYIAAENGEVDFSFTFIYKCAEKFNVDMIEILTGDNPRLSYYSIVRKGEGLPMKRRSGFRLAPAARPRERMGAGQRCSWRNSVSPVRKISRVTSVAWSSFI